MIRLIEALYTRKINIQTLVITSIFVADQVKCGPNRFSENKNLIITQMKFKAMFKYYIQYKLISEGVSLYS